MGRAPGGEQENEGGGEEEEESDSGAGVGPRGAPSALDVPPGSRWLVVALWVSASCRQTPTWKGKHDDVGTDEKKSTTARHETGRWKFGTKSKAVLRQSVTAPVGR